jgi:L-ribulose-5-phosphate 3-epimerase
VANVRIGLNAGIFPGGPGPIEAVRLARAAGADGLELNVGEKGPLSLETPEAELRAIRRAAEEAGVELPSIHCGLHWRYTLSDPDEAVRRRGLEVLGRTLEIGAVLGCRVLLVVPGVVKPEVPYADAYARAQEGVAALARRAEALGLRLGVENVWNRLLLSPLEMARFLDEIGSPAVGAYFDVGNILLYGYPQHWIATLGRRIVAVHFKDYRLDVPGGGGFVYLLQGDVPWAACMAALRAVGYDGYVTAELPPYRHLPERTAADTVAAMRAILALGA